MDEKAIQAIIAALKNGFRVELVMQKDGSIVAQTVSRKKLNIDPRHK